MKPTKENLDTIFTAALTLSAVVMAAVFVWREVSSDPYHVGVRPGGTQEPEFYEDWKAWLSHGERIGANSAAVVVIAFTDFECPFCNRFHQTVLKEAMEEFGTSVSATIVPFPLQRLHRFAESSAVAAACAAEQGGFEAYVDLLFLKQDSLGLKSWSAYAQEAGISDQISFQNCVEAQRPLERVRAARNLGEEIGITGTPTIFINGWRLPTPPGQRQLSQVIQRVLDGEEVSKALGLG